MLQFGQGVADTESDKIKFRSICVDDLEPIRALHEDCFPVRYADSFYQAAVRERMVGTDDPLYTLIAEVENDTGDRQIVGFVTAQLTTTKKCGDNDILFTPRSNFRAAETMRVMYILTLGTHARYRRRGLARYMLKQCKHLFFFIINTTIGIRRAEQIAGCGVVYLHVITHNDGAIQFYKSNKFRYLGELQDYYRINGALYNCFVYAYYLPKSLETQFLGATKPTTATTPKQQKKSFLPLSWTGLVPTSLRSCLLATTYDRGDSSSTTTQDV